MKTFWISGKVQNLKKIQLSNADIKHFAFFESVSRSAAGSVNDFVILVLQKILFYLVGKLILSLL